MKIISFWVNNFCWISGWIETNTIHFNNSNTIFLFWQNNVWKSTFLKAYDFFYNNSKIWEDDLNTKNTWGVIEFELVLELDDFDFQKINENAPWKLESIKKFLKDDKLLRIKREIYSELKGEKIDFKKAENHTYDFTSNTWIKKNYWGIGLDNVFQSLLPKPIFIQAMPTEEQVEKIINEILSQKAEKWLKGNEREELKQAKQKIKELQDKVYNPTSIKTYKEEVNKNFQKLFPDNKIELEEIDKLVWSENKIWKNFKIHFEKIDSDWIKDSNIPTNYSKIWHWAIRSAIFSLLLMKDVAEEFERQENRKDYLVLFEEPELFLHPKLMKELRSLIYKVTEDDFPYQILCASHSPQMIDISKPKSSLVRMQKIGNDTFLYQIDEQFLLDSTSIKSKIELKQEMNEVLRFNPFICESFYSDDVILIEWPTEEIIIRWYLSEKWNNKDVFIVNCWTVNNIPFYQKIFSKFKIKYHIICDTDTASYDWIDENGIKKFTSGIQKSIYQQYLLDKAEWIGINLFYHENTFEPAHNSDDIPLELRFIEEDYKISDWKPYNANLYWKNILSKNIDNQDILKVPIISFIKKIID